MFWVSEQFAVWLDASKTLQLRQLMQVRRPSEAFLEWRSKVTSMPEEEEGDEDEEEEVEAAEAEAAARRARRAAATRVTERAVGKEAMLVLITIYIGSRKEGRRSVQGPRQSGWNLL